MSPRGGFDEELLTRVLSDFAHTLAGRFDVSEVLYRLCEHVIAILHVDGAGVSLLDDRGRLRPVTAVNELSRRLEAAEEEHQQGPCVEVSRLGIEVVVPDLDERAESWPAWYGEARVLGVRSVLGIPLRLRDQLLGALNVYSVSERQWREPEVRVARVLNDMAASYLANASELDRAKRTAEQLREALESRVVIEQAKGVLSAEQHVSVDRAFGLLRDHARRNGASLREVASAVVTLGLRPSRQSGPPAQDRQDRH